MPGTDRTGPEGKGSRTGRGMGKCNPSNESNNTDMPESEIPRGRGRGLGRRWEQGFGGGQGRGLGNGRGMGRGRS